MTLKGRIYRLLYPLAKIYWFIVRPKTQGAGCIGDEIREAKWISLHLIRLDDFSHVGRRMYNLFQNKAEV